MENRQESIVNRNNGLCSFFGLNTVVFASDAAFEAIVTKMIADTAAANAAAVAAAADNTGFSADKVINKRAAAEMAAILCGSSQVKLNMLGNNSLSKSLNDGVYFYNDASDAMSATRLMSVYNVMHTNLALITITYLTAAQLVTFLGLITAFTSQNGTTTAVNKGMKVLTAQFDTALKLTSADVVVVKKLVKGYKISNPLFYNGVMQACRVLAVSVRHTPVTFNITSTGTGTPIVNVSGTLSKSKEVQKSDMAGIMLFPTVHAGLSIATFVKAGYLTGVIEIKIKQGKPNGTTIALSPGTMTEELEAKVQEQLSVFVAKEDATKALKVAKAEAKKKAKELLVVSG